MTLFAFFVGLGTASIAWFIIGIGVLIAIISFKKIFGQEGYPLYKVINKNGAVRVSYKKLVWPMPRHYDGEPKDVYKTFETTIWTNLFASQGKNIELNKSNFTVFEGIEKDDSMIIEGVNEWRSQLLDANKKLKFDLAQLKLDNNKMKVELMRLKQLFNVELDKGVDKVLMQVSKINPFVKHETSKKKPSGGSYGGR